MRGAEIAAESARWRMPEIERVFVDDDRAVVGKIGEATRGPLEADRRAWPRGVKPRRPLRARLCMDRSQSFKARLRCAFRHQAPESGGQKRQRGPRMRDQRDIAAEVAQTLLCPLSSGQIGGLRTPLQDGDSIDSRASVRRAIFDGDFEGAALSRAWSAVAR